MGSYVDMASPLLRAALAGFTSAITYIPYGGTAVELVAFIRGLRQQDTFAAAMQQDQVAVIDAVKFKAALGYQLPRRLDRIVQDSQSFAVVEWRAAPAVLPYVELKLLIRGSQQ